MKHTKLNIYALGLAGALIFSMPAIVSAEETTTVATEAESGTEETTETVYTETEIIQAVQQALNDAGFDCGTPDGLAGSKTAAAITAYQKEKKLTENGTITDELLESLGVAEKLAAAARREAMMKEFSADYTYTQVARKPINYVGKKMIFRGEVLQSDVLEGDTRYIRLAVDSDYNSVLFITYENDIIDVNLLNRDIITVYGECKGDYTYESAMGVAMTLPYLDAVAIDLSEISTM